MQRSLLVFLICILGVIVYAIASHVNPTHYQEVRVVDPQTMTPYDIEIDVPLPGPGETYVWPCVHL